MKFFIILLLIIIILRMIGKMFRPILGFSAANERMRQMQEQMKEMNERMNENTRRSTTTRKKEGDYIDYEEIK